MHHCHRKGHHHGYLPIILYFVGLLLFSVARFIENNQIAAILDFTVVILSGFFVLKEGIENTIQVTIAQRKLRLNTHILMLLSAIGAILIQYYSEAATLILIFAGAHFLEEYVDSRSKRDITSLLNLKPVMARVRRDTRIEIDKIENIQVGDILMVLNGDLIPLDGIVVKGTPLIDESTINGESVPREKTIDSEVYAGTLNVSDSFEMKVTRRSEDTLLTKILTMVDEAQHSKGKLQSLIDKIEPIYVGIILLFVPLVFSVFRYGFHLDIETSYYRSLIYLVSASPCALALSVTPATLAAISSLARKNVLFKQSSYLAHFKKVKAIVFDKTGTLTTGEMKVIDSYYCEENDELKSIIYAIEQRSNHPLSIAIQNYLQNYAVDKELEIENISGIGIVAKYNNDIYKIGNPNYFNDTDEFAVKRIKYQSKGATVVYVAKNDKVIALYVIMDTIKQDAKSTIYFLKQYGIKTIMITGDNELSAKYVATALELDEYYANVLPDQKYEHIVKLKEKYAIVAMFGDGVNDAPALAKADISVAMGAGSDIAIETSDVVLMNNNISSIDAVYYQSMKLEKIIIQNMLIAFGMIGLLLIMNLFQITNIFLSVIGHEGSTLLILLNSLRLLSFKRN